MDKNDLTAGRVQIIAWEQMWHTQPQKLSVLFHTIQIIPYYKTNEKEPRFKLECGAELSGAGGSHLPFSFLLDHPDS